MGVSTSPTSPPPHPYTMASHQPYTMAHPQPRDVSNPIASGPKRPSAFDRFPGDVRNNWLNEMQAKIDRAIYPPPPSGPSRSPSPLEEDEIAEDVEGEVEYEEDVAGSEEYEEDGSDENEGYEEDDGMDPLGLESQTKRVEAEDGIFDDEEDYEEDEGFEEEEDIEDDMSHGQPPVPQTQQHLEDEDPARQDLIDPQIEDQLEGEYEEDSEDQEEEDELEGEEPHLEDREDAGTEDDVMFVGDTDEEEEGEESEENQDAEMLGEDEDELEADELDDDGMGDPDELAEDLPLEQEGSEVEHPYQAAPVGVEDGQLVYDLPSSQTTLPEVTYTNPYQLVDPQTSEMPPFQASNALYPPLPEFTNFTPAFTSAASMIPPWEPTPLADQVIASGQSMENDLIDPSLLADFAQRVEAQASGDLGNTTESQNTSEMTALADAVMNQYDEPAPVAQLGEEVEVFQHGMGEAEGDGYAEDHDSQSSTGTGAEPSSQPIVDNQAESDDDQEDYSDEEMESENDSGAAAASPDFVNTADDPIELLSSDEEDDEEGDEPLQDGEEDQGSSEGSQNGPEDQEVDDHDDDEEEEEEEQEELEPERPTASHIRFDLDRSDLLSPSRPSSRFSARTPAASQPVSPSAAQAEYSIPTEEVDELEGDDEDEAQASERTPSPAVAEPDIPSAMPIMDPIERATSVEPSPQQPIPDVTIIETTEEMQVDDAYEVEEPVSRGPSMPLVTPAVELPLDTIFPTVPEAGLDAILRVFAQQPEVEEESEEVEIDMEEGPEQLGYEVEDEIVAVQSTSELVEEEAPVKVGIVAEANTSILADDREDEGSSDEEGIVAEQSASVTSERDDLPSGDEIVAEASTSTMAEDEPLGEGETVPEETTSVHADEDVDDNGSSDDSPNLSFKQSPSLASVTDYATAEVTMDQLPDPHAAPSATDLTTPDVPFHRSRTPSLIVEPPAQAPDPESVAPVAIDYAMVETTPEVLPDPLAEPVATELTMPDVPFHRSRTPSLIVEPPANPPNPEIVIDRPTDEEMVSPTELPDPQDPIPDSHLPQPLSPHTTRPVMERSPSTFVNVQEVDIMLDPGPNEDREETPVELPEHDQPAPQTDLVGPIEPEDLSPRDEPRSVSMEALAPGEAPLKEMIMTGTGTGTGTVDSREDSPVLFPGPGEAAPNTYIPSPLDVRRDLPLDVDMGSETAPSLLVEPPSEPVTGPPSLTGSAGEEVQPDLLGLPNMVVDGQAEEFNSVPTSSSIDVPSAPLRAATPDNDNEAGPSNTDNTRFLSPLRHHHGHGPRQASVPPPTTRATRRHTRQSSHAAEALSPTVTRQNCHYRKLYIVQDDMSAVVLVPQCTLTDHDKMEEEHAEDRGDATPADEAQARGQPICEATPRLHLALTAKLHRIVGSDIFDEAQKTYLLQASEAALLPDDDEEEKEEIVASTSKTRRASTSTSPIKPRRSKRLSEAPSESFIKEESSTTQKRSASIAKTASPVLEAEEADDGVDVNGGEPYDLRSKSEVSEAEAEEDMESEAGTEIVAEEGPQPSSSLTPSPSFGTKKDDQSSSSKRYSLRSQPEVVEAEETSQDRPTTPSPVKAEVQTTPILMTTRLRARESVGPTSAKSPSSDRKPRSSDEQHVKFEEPSTPQLKGRRKSQPRSKGKGKAQEDSKYVYEDDEEEEETDEDEDVKVKVKDEEEEERQSRQSTAEIIPFDQIQPDSHSPSTTSGTGIKKRKLRTSSSSNSPWQLRGVGEEADHGGSPSGGRGKRRAVESKEEPDVPVPEEVGEEEEQEEMPLPPPKGWMSYIWPFKKS